ncbi:MAG: HAD family hydrolase [Candidatus Bathyarchaeia archaeon]
MSFKAVIFDKDGVLINSFSTVLSAMNEALTLYGYDKISGKEFRRSWWGIRADLNIEMKLGITREEALEIFECYKQRREELRGMTKPYPGVYGVLRELRGDYSLGVVTSTFRDVAMGLLDEFGISKFFDVVVGGDETKPKPAPDPLLKACAGLMVRPDDAIYVGDTDADICAGKSAGCTTVIVTTSKTKEELDEIRGIIIIDELKELLDIVNS